jgi:ArsR family transcriptional regulator
VYDDAAAAAALLSIAADPNRMAILMLLANGSVRVRTFKARIPIAPTLLSYHLRVLRDAGLIVGRRQGRWMDYELVGDAFERLRRAIPTPTGEAGSSPPSSATTCSGARAGPRTRRVAAGRRRHGHHAPPHETSENTF